MGQQDPSDPVVAWRARLARYAREEMDLGNAAQQSEAITRLGRLEMLDRRRRVLRLLLTLGYAAVVALLVLMLVCATAIVWIALKSDAPAATRIASVTGTVSAFGAIVWGLLKYAERRLDAMASENAPEGTEAALPLQRDASLLRRLWRRLPDRLR